jgi:hypothetical protein
MVHYVKDHFGVTVTSDEKLTSLFTSFVTLGNLVDIFEP